VQDFDAHSRGLRVWGQQQLIHRNAERLHLRNDDMLKQGE